jgi:hypothetical protein
VTVAIPMPVLVAFFVLALLILLFFDSWPRP